MPKPTARLEVLDFLRFIAASSVILQHILENISPSFRSFCTEYFQFGIFGVCIFFLISGFIIPVSLEKHQSVKTFWINRIFRLYPLFLTSLILKLTLLKLDWISGSYPSATAIIANVTMLAKFIGQPLIEALYWTLNLEMVFYIIVTLLFSLKLLTKSILIGASGLFISLLIGVVAPQLLHLQTSGWGLVFNLATMFIGTLYYRHMKGSISGKTLAGMLSLTMLVLLINTYFNLYEKDIPEALGTKSFLPVTNAFIAAYFLFTLCYYFKDISYPRIVLFLGNISYSLYLNQAIILSLAFLYIPNIYLSSLIAILGTFFMSYYTYKYIELPFVAFGRRVVTYFQAKAVPTTNN